MHNSNKNLRKLLLLAALAVAGAGLGLSALAQSPHMTFFITSAGPGDGANLNWKAYLSVNAKIDRSSGKAKVIPGVNARDRIGNGPWHNAKGVLIASNVDELHSASNPINKDTGLDERGNPVNDRSKKPNRHDILTGSDPQGLYSTAGGDTTCSGWTSNGKGSAIVGHHDRAGLSQDWHMLSWNSAHGTVGCGRDDLPKTGGNGLFYCFNAD
jgi:hypothetical protein